MSNILIVEDNPDLSNAYKLVLERQGHNITTAFNGQEALDILKDDGADKIEVILLDLLMPKMNGIELLQKIRHLPKHKNVLVIVLSNLKEDDEVSKALKLGAYKYILKANTTPKELAIQVNHLIGKL